MTQVNVYIARHFWRDGQVATWRTHEHFPPVFLGWLKEHYTELVTGRRPPWIERPQGVLYLFFKDEHEVHGRRATGITVFWSDADVVDRDVFRDQLLRSSALANNDCLYLKTKANISKPKSYLKKYLTLTLFATSLVVGTIYFIKNLPDPPPAKVDNSTKTITSEQQAKEIKNLTPAKKIKKPEDVCIWSEYSKMDKPAEYCYQKYINFKCLNKTTLNYRDWVKQERNGTLLNCPLDTTAFDSDLDDYLKKLDKKEYTELKKFLEK